MTRQEHAQELVAWVADQLGREVPNASDAVRRIAEVPDEAVRVQMAELLVCAERNERSKDYDARRANDEQRKGQEEQVWLVKLLEQCCQGEYGQSIKDRSVAFAQQIQQRRIPASIGELRGWRSAMGRMSQERRAQPEQRGRRAAQ